MRIRLGLTDDEISNSTPGQISALARQFQQGKEAEDLRFASLMALIANVHRGKNRPAFKPSDFMARRTSTRKRKFTPTPAAQALWLKLKYGPLPADN